MRFSFGGEAQRWSIRRATRRAPLVLSSDEREYLTRQVRRHRVALINVRTLPDLHPAMWRWLRPVRRLRLNWAFTNTPWAKWRRRFLKDRVEGLLDEMRAGRPRTSADDLIAAVIERTLRSTPTDANTLVDPLHGWSHRIFTHDDPQDLDGVRPAAASRLRRPSSFRAIRSSSTRSAIFVGLYLSPPNRALVLSVDEKSQIQALDCANSRFCR